MKPRTRTKIGSSSIATHASFVPGVTVWGAALFGLSFVVLPFGATEKLATLSGLHSLGGTANLIFTAFAALLGGGLAFVSASALRDIAKRKSERVSVISGIKSERSQPIDPAADLGSASLDDPIEEMPLGLTHDEPVEAEVSDPLAEQTEESKPQPTLGELSRRGYDLDDAQDSENESASLAFTRRHFEEALIETCEGATCEAAAPVGSDDEQVSAKLDTPAEDIANTTASPIVVKPDESAPERPLGRPAGTDSWSLTQFDPADHKTTQGIQTDSAKAAESKPKALDLAEFAEMPGRNAVWVEEEASLDENSAPSKESKAPVGATRPKALPASALEKLRETAPDDLSMVQMVERFAGALHQYQDSERARQPHAAPLRDAALAEALKALTLFTERGFDQSAERVESDNLAQLSETERDLREALGKLQSLRGAA